MTIGEKIKELRLQKGLTQEELGNAIGVQKAAIHKYETGLVEVGVSKIKILSQILGTSPIYLLGLDVYDESNSPVFELNVKDPKSERSMASDIVLESMVRSGNMNAVCDAATDGIYKVKMTVNGFDVKFGDFVNTLQQTFDSRLTELNNKIKMSEEEAIQKAMANHKVKMKKDMEQTLDKLRDTISSLESAAEDFIDKSLYTIDKETE